MSGARPPLVASLGARDIEGAIADARALPAEADLVEVRLDRFAQPKDVDLARLARELGRPALCTVRSRAQGGEFDGAAGERAALLASAQRAGFAWIDVEEDVAAAVPRAGARRVASWHAREATADGAAPVRALLGLDADVVKVAAPAADAASAFRFVQSAAAAGAAAGRAAVAIAMGAAGRWLRPLAGKFGMPLVYAAAHPSRRTADGQITVADYLDAYRARAVGPNTRVFAVAGQDVAASLSPVAHNAVFHEMGVDAILVDVSTPEFEQVAAVARALPIDGLAVTAPFKRDALRFADDAEADARAITAANTLVRDGAGRFLASNTDAPGFLAALDLAVARPEVTRDFCVGHSAEALELVGVVAPGPERERPVRPVHTALVHGTGGVAAAIAFGLRQRGVRVCVTGRSFDRAAALVMSLASAAPGGIEAISSTRAASLGFELLVKAVPGADGGGFPVDFTPYRRGSFAADVVYRPVDTEFLREARRFGMVPVPGMLMFAAQAALQAARFTGARADVVRPLLARSLGSIWGQAR